MNLEYVKNHPTTSRKHAVIAVTANFLLGLTRALSESELELSVLKNAQREPGDPVDFLHDYTDANLIIINALEETFLQDEFDLQDDFVSDLIRDCWAQAGHLLAHAYGYGA